MPAKNSYERRLLGRNLGVVPMSVGDVRVGVLGGCVLRWWVRGYGFQEREEEREVMVRCWWEWWVI